MKAVVFDIGQVLVRWDARLAFRDSFNNDAEIEAFLDRVDFSARNLRADSGESFTDLAAEIEDPEDASRFAAYVKQYPLTVPDKIDGTWALLHRLKAAGMQVHAITNWSAETWPAGLEAHPELAEVFGVTVVSGQEKMLKPNAAIFNLLCARTGLAPEDCVFVDDSPKNVAGARAVGMDAIHFTTPDALEAALAERGLV